MRTATKAFVLITLILLSMSSYTYAELLSSSGSINYTEYEGFRFESSVKLAMPFGRFRTYINMEIYQSSKREQFWNNKIAFANGGEFNLPITLIPGAEWQNYTIGAKAVARQYTDIDDIDFEFVPYFNWGFGGRFKSNLPYSSWGNINRTDIDGVKLETSFKQGYRIKRVIPYGEIGLTQSSKREDYWNNKVSVRLGIDYVLPIKLFRGWEGYRTGIKAGYNFATDDDIIEFTFTAYIINWNFGGVSISERTF